MNEILESTLIPFIGTAAGSACVFFTKGVFSDKIKNTLGTNFEYFYDADGNFIFREKKNFLNTTQATIELENMENSNYIVDMTRGKSVYDFNNSPIVSSFASTPKYSEIIAPPFSIISFAKFIF